LIFIISIVGFYGSIKSIEKIALVNKKHGKHTKRRNEFMQLFYKDIYLGDIIMTGGDFPWMHGDFIKHSEYGNFKNFFNFLVSKEKKNEDLKNIDADLFDENNWTIKNEEEIIGIFELYRPKMSWDGTE